MKNLLYITLVLLGSSCFADPAEHALKWLKLTVPSGDKTYAGRTSDGQPCALVITHKSDNYYMITVGPQKSDNENLEDYIGVYNNESSVQYSQGYIVFDSANSWGNSSKFNKVHIEFGRDGFPDAAAGTSDLKSIICILN